MLRMIGTPCERAARATARSASLCKNREDADGRDHDRHRQSHSQHLDAEIAAPDVAQETRHDSPAAKCLAVRADGLFRACPAGHIIVGGRSSTDSALRSSASSETGWVGNWPSRPAR